MTHMSLNADGEAQSEQVWPQQQQQHVELQPGASKHQTAEFFLWTFKASDYGYKCSLVEVTRASQAYLQLLKLLGCKHGGLAYC
jgi:hypothetical protein